MKKIQIYTDGACSGNPGKGGWGAVLIYNGKTREISGYEEATTNNRMELQAAIEAISAVKEKCEIDLFTDSKYVKDGITTWIHNWQKNGWKNSQKDEVKNADLWKILIDLTKNHKISWHWVKGHADNEFNNLADKLATEAIRR